MATQVNATATSTREVFDHHIGALGTGDLDDLMSDYSEESILIGPDGVVKGLTGIRQVFEFFLSGLLKPGTYEIGLDKVHVEGEIVYVLWHANCVGADVTFAADTFLIRSGKIALQTFAPKLEPHG